MNSWIFTPPPLRLLVSTLDHVPGRYLGREDGHLGLEDVRNDALCQRLVLDNQRLKKRIGWLVLIVIALGGLLVGMVTTYKGTAGQVAKPAPVSVPLVALQAHAPASTPASVPVPAVATPAQPPASEPVSVPAPAGAALDEDIDRRMKAIGAMQELLKLVENPGTGMRTPINQLTVVPAIKTMPVKPPAPATPARPAQAVTTGSTTTPAATAPAALPGIKIMDFFGFNTAVMISTGGDAERTYRVGDVLPSGETVTRIDSQAGQMQTNKRTINR